MNKIERVTAVVRGEKPDRPPISFWYHFAQDERDGERAVAAHLSHFETYDLDFLKVMYDLGYPFDGPVRGIDDLSKLAVLNGDEGVFGRHLSTVRAIASRLSGEALISTTIFNAWATLRRLLLTDSYKAGSGPSPADDPRSARIVEFVSHHGAAVRDALTVISRSLANFARCCIDAGADGVFLSVRDDWVGAGEDGRRRYDELVRDTDRRILAGAAAGRFNLLHVCGKAVDFDAFTDYPVHAINWADRTAGPALADLASSLRPAPCAGLNQLQTLRDGSEAQCVAEVHDALAQAGDRPIIIAPGCTYDPAAVPAANLHAVCQAVGNC